MKKILFDVYELAPGAGKSMGVYNYARHLLAAIAQSPRDDFEITVVCNPAALSDFSPVDPKGRIKHLVRGDGPPTLAQRLWWIFGAAGLTCRSLGVDVYFSPRGFLPYSIGSIRSVVTIHDLIRVWYKENFPGYFSKAEEWFVCRSLLRSARRSDWVIAISKWSESDIRSRTGRNGSISVVYNGLAANESIDHPKSREGFFAIGSILPHKNTKVLIEAYKRYRQASADPASLCICGGVDPKVEGINFVHKLTDAELGVHYARARAFIFPSLIEGFGFPPVEAMAHGTPIVCSDIEVLREVTKGVGRYFSPSDIDGLAGELLGFDYACSTAEEVSAELARKQIAQSYDWAATAEQTLSVILR